MEAKLEYLENGIRLFDFSHYPEDVKSGNPYNTSFLVEVTSEGFSGVSFWEYDLKNLKKFCCEMRELYEFKISDVVFSDIRYGSKIVFSVAKNGKMTVSGTVFGKGAEQSLIFTFGADQTVIPSFVNGIARMISEAENADFAPFV